jgi:hypothetical protein
MLLKTLYDPEWQGELEELFMDEYGLDLKLKVKGMEPLDLRKYGFSENEHYEMDFEDATTVASYRSILDNTDSSKERMLVKGHMGEVDVLTYLTRTYPFLVLQMVHMSWIVAFSAILASATTCLWSFPLSMPQAVKKTWALSWRT